MTAATTIKVPRELRDRIAVRAREKGTTFAAVIANALDVSEVESFWARVAVDNARMPRPSTPGNYDEGGLRDHVERADDAVGRDEW